MYVVFTFSTYPNSITQRYVCTFLLNVIAFVSQLELQVPVRLHTGVDNFYVQVYCKFYLSCLWRWTLPSLPRFNVHEFLKNICIEYLNILTYFLYPYSSMTINRIKENYIQLFVWLSWFYLIYFFFIVIFDDASASLLFYLLSFFVISSFIVW